MDEETKRVVVACVCYAFVASLCLWLLAGGERCDGHKVQDAEFSRRG